MANQETVAVIRNLHLALLNLQRAINNSAITLPLAAAPALWQALGQAREAQEGFSAWSLSDRQ